MNLPESSDDEVSDIDKIMMDLSGDSPVVVEKKKRRVLPNGFGGSQVKSAKKPKKALGRAGQTHIDSFLAVEQSDVQEIEDRTPVVAALPETFIEYEIENVKLKFPFRVRFCTCIYRR